MLRRHSKEDDPEKAILDALGARVPLYQREWTPEALLVHYADDIDAKYQMMAAILHEDTTPGPVTSKKNVLFQQVYRGPA